MRTQVKLSLDKTSTPELIENGRHYVSCIGSNATTFVTPNPALAGVTTLINGVETAHTNALGGGRALTAILHEKRAILETALTQLGHYVETIANGTESIILLAGMQVKGKGGRRPAIFAAKPSPLPSELILNAPYYANHSYIWQMVKEPIPDAALAIDPAHAWTQIGVSNKGSFTVTGLAVGEKYWFRYATVSKDGQSGWSDPISKIVTE